MSDFTKFWLNVNKKHIVMGILAAAVFTAIGGGAVIAIIFYTISISVCFMNSLMVLWHGGSDSTALDFVMSLPFTHADIYDTCIKMMLLQSVIYAAIYAVGTALLGNITGSGRILPLIGININETPLTALAYYLFVAGLFMIVLTVLVSMVNAYGALKKIMIIISVIYIAPVNYMIYAVYVTIVKEDGRNNTLEMVIIAILAAASLAVTMYVFLHGAKKARRMFVTG